MPCQNQVCLRELAAIFDELPHLRNSAFYGRILTPKLDITITVV